MQPFSEAECLPGFHSVHRFHFGMEYEVSEVLHRSAPHDLPGFITAPGDTNTLMVVVGVILLAAVLGVGNLYLRLHTLPERMAYPASAWTSVMLARRRLSLCRRPRSWRIGGMGNGALAIGPKLPRPSSTLPDQAYWT
jgi:hypothetical protein